jgi:3-dehydrotetronate 4-kinase
MIGCVADDYTGATDVASAFRRAGLRTALFFGEPRPHWVLPPCDVAVVALKIRNVPAAEAIRAARKAQTWLAAEQAYFKYCSTFDSTDAGNIGPVADALLDATGGQLTLVCPAAPEHTRTVYMGHLFVSDRLLSESAMRDHPLTPMRDPDLVRVLARQTSHPVELVPHDMVRQGPAAVGKALSTLIERGVRYAVTDAICRADLDCLAAAGRDLPLLTGAAGFAASVAALRAPVRDTEPGVALPAGPSVILAGSCSPATLSQVAHARQRLPAHRLDPLRTPDVGGLLAEAQACLDRHMGIEPVLIYASAAASDRDSAYAAMIEQTIGLLARHAVAQGARRLVVAGGETSGAVVDAIGVESVVVGDELAMGVPWLVSISNRPLALVLKSGNFGAPDLLVRAVTDSTQTGC